MLVTNFIKHHFLIFSLSITVISSYVISFSPWLDTSPHDDQRFIQLIFLFISGSYSLIHTLKYRSLPASLLSTSSFWLIAFFGLGVISALVAFSTEMAFAEIVIFLLLWLASVYVANEITLSPEYSINWIFKFIGYGAALYAFKFAVAYTTAFIVSSQPNSADLFLGFSNYRFFNHAQTITLPFLVLLYINGTQNGNKKYGWLLLSGFWWSLLLLSSARGTFIGLLFGCVIAYYLLRNQSVIFVKAMLISGLVGIAMYYLFFVAIPVSAGFLPFGDFVKLEQRTAISPTSGRIVLWQWALQLILGNPWLGIGPMHYTHDAPNFKILGHPHNWVLQIGAEWGLLALLCLCIAIYMAFKLLLKTRSAVAFDDKKNQTFLTAWLVIGIAILTDGLVSGTIVMPLSQCLIALYLACVMGWRQSMSTAGGTNQRLPIYFKTTLTFSSILLFSLGIILITLWTGITKIKNYKNDSPIGVIIKVPDPNYPRLWIKGRF